MQDENKRAQQTAKQKSQNAKKAKKPKSQKATKPIANSTKLEKHESKHAGRLTGAMFSFSGYLGLATFLLECLRHDERHHEEVESAQRHAHEEGEANAVLRAKNASQRKSYAKTYTQQ